MIEYQKIIDSNIQALQCPFCFMPHELVLDQTEHCLVLLTRAPYTKDHILLVPKRHVIFYRDLTRAELDEFDLLIHRWMEKLRKHYSDVNLLLRDGTANGKIGKSVDHLHFHLIPDLIIWGQDVEKMRNRKFYDEDEYLSLVKQFKKDFDADE